MFSDAKWARYVAERGRPGMDGPPPDELHVVPANYTHLQAYGRQGLDNTPAFGGHLSVDLDVGAAGIAIGSLCAAMPYMGGGFVVTAADPIVLSGLRFFAPGVYRWIGRWQSLTALSLGKNLRWVFCRFDSTSGNLRPISGAPTIFEEDFYSPNTSAVIAQFEGLMYCPGPWIALLLNVDALVDADRFTTSLTIWPEYVFDEAGAT